MNLTIPVIPHYKKGQVLYYGFRITEEWLIKHGITHGAAYNFPDYESHVMNVYYARLILQQQTGIKQLAFEFVLPEKPTHPTSQRTQTKAPSCTLWRMVGSYSRSAPTSEIRFVNDRVKHRWII